MAFRTRFRHRRGVASVGTVSIFSTALAVLAIANPGLDAAEVELNDGGIWITNSAEGMLGRFNHQAQAVDGVIEAQTASFDVYQHGDAVLLEDGEFGTLRVVDVSLVEAAPPADLPGGVQVGLGGGVAAVLDGNEGRLWVMPAARAGSFSTEGTEPVAEEVIEPAGLVGARLAVGVDGTVHVASEAAATLTSIPTDDGAPMEPRTRPLDGVTVEAELTVTAVGDDGIVLDGAAGRLFLPGRVVDVEGTGAVLQQPGTGGPQHNTVVYATDSALVTQPLGGGSPDVAPAGATSAPEMRPAAPVQVKGCAYGAWAGTGQVVRSCRGSEPVAQALEGLPADAELRYRTNHGVVVLNDVGTGFVWLAEQDFLLLEDAWQDARASRPSDDEEQDPSEERSRDPLEDRDLPNRPPVANDDEFGVRPGRTTILAVLDNDTDPDGDVLTSSVAGAAPSIGQVDAIYGGRALQVTVPPDAAGTATFDYEVDDGREGGTDTARVTLTVRGQGVNGLPQVKEGRETVAVVELGKAVEVNVLADWFDPDGDPLVLVGAEATTPGDEVRSRPDGFVTFQDAGTSPGRKEVTIRVSDGFGEVTGSFVVDVRPGEMPPDALADHATTAVGRPVVIRPLENDTDPNGDDLRLVRVEARTDVSIVPDYEAGTITFTASAPGPYTFTYEVADGPNTALGLVRVDVLAGGFEALPPVAVQDRALVPTEGSVLVDVLGNDIDPAGGVLVVQSVTVPPGAPISAAIVNHEIVRITAIRALDPGAALTVYYQVSNGISSATGEIVVVPLPAPDVVRSPTANPDEVTVRAGDVVTIPVLANDTHPQDLPLRLVRDLVSEPDPASGLIFTTEDSVRFQAGATPGTVYATYEVMVDSVGSQAEPDSAQITIHIRADDDTNSAPRPQNLTARVLAGSVTRIAVPLDGIDPDGDSVRLLGLDLSGGQAPGLGRVVGWGEGWIDYEANPGAGGTDSFVYAVEDARGEQAKATVLVGVAPAPSVNQNPVALDDLVTARPGREVAVAVLTNDVDPEGGVLVLTRAEEPEGQAVLAPEVRDGRVVVRTPAAPATDPATYSVVYTVRDALEGTASAAVVVTVTPSAPLRAPVARDDALTLADVAGRTAVDVPVVRNDDDPDGSTADLRVTTPAETARVLADGQVRVTLTPEAQILPYTVTDVDEQSATAFVRVPGLADLRPVLRAGLSLEVNSGEPLTIDLGDVVLVAPDKDPTITRADRVLPLKGTREIVDRDTIIFTSDPGYFGPAAVTVEVTDGTGPDDPAGRTAVLTLPITVLKVGGDVGVVANTPPSFTAPSLSVPAGESTSVRLSAVDPDPDDAARLRFSIAGEMPAGFAARIGPDGATLEVSADREIDPGTSDSLGLALSDGTNEPVQQMATLTVVRSTKPLATVVDDVVDRANQGQAYPVDVLANDVNPFPGEPFTVVFAGTESGDGTVSFTDTQVVVTPGADFVGTMVVRYRVADATGDASRQVDGRIRLTVRGAPEAPLTPTVQEVRSETVVLTWAPPLNNGAPIEYYEVTSASGPASSQRCDATTCTLTGLTNNQTYTFQVVAHNEVGDSEPSPPSAEARPDQRPDVPQPPTLVFGDGSLTVSWVNQTYSDRSPIQSVNLQISPAPASGPLEIPGQGGTQYVWAGLTNSTPYTVRVQAVNLAPEPSDWSAYSASETPAGIPAVPAAPSAAIPTESAGQAQMIVSWAAPFENGDPISAYTLTVQGGGAATRTIAVPGGTTSQAVTVATSETSYTFTVAATNKAGTSAASAASAPRRGVIPPGAVTGLQATPQDRAIQLAFGAAPGNGATAGEIRYEYSANGGASWATLGSDKRVGGLTNGTTYAIQVRAVSVVDGQTYTGPPTTAPAVVPYGPVGTPGVNAVGGPTYVDLSWTAPGPNGRDVAIYISVDGGGWENVGSSGGSRRVGNDYNQTHSIRAEARDTANQVATSNTAQASTWSTRNYTVADAVVGGHCAQNTRTSAWVMTSGSCDGTWYPNGRTVTVYCAIQNPTYVVKYLADGSEVRWSWWFRTTGNQWVRSGALGTSDDSANGMPSCP